MRRIFNKLNFFSLVLSIIAAMLISVMFFSWRDFKSLNQTGVRQEETVITTESAVEEHGPITSHKEDATEGHRPIASHKVKRVVAKRRAEIQADTSQIEPNLRKHDQVFEKAMDLREDAVNIIQTGE